MNFPKLSKIFKTRKPQPKTTAVGVTQGPKAKGQGLGLINKNAAGINPSTAGEVSKTGAWPPVARKQLDDICAFLARFLHCSDHQRNLLALWVLHSYCFSAFDFTPYLSVHSTKAQSGKTRCLQLLSLLCPNPALTASFATNNLSSRIHYSEQRPTFLLDQCHATVGSRRRSKNPVLRAILASGFQRGVGHTDRKGERVLFSPKAFAGIGLLPEDLAECSIPIHLERLSASVRLQTFRSEAVEAEAQPLRQWLAFWGQQNLQKLKSAPALDLEDFPFGIVLNPRRKDLIEPLLQIARLLAGDWPKRAADALTFVFQDQVTRERKHALALLSELREAFSHYGQPARIATASLLAWLHHQPDAPWNQEGLISATRLADILRPFNIFPRQQRKKGESNHRGYTMQDFLYTWDMLLPREPSMNRDTSRRDPMPSPPKPTPADQASMRAFKASEPQPQTQVSPNKNAAGINVSTTSEVSTISANQCKPVPAGRGSAAQDSGVAVTVTQGPKVADPGVPRTNGQGPGLINKNAAGINVSTASDVSNISGNQSKSPADSGVAVVSTAAAGRNLSPVTSNLSPALPKLDPRLKGILDDPYNYFRQYPDDGDRAKLEKLVTVDHRWPQPADDKMPPDAVFTMEDGTRLPFTNVNREPKTINAFGDFKNERWPVMLNEKERLQVAVARFHELRAAAKAALEENARVAQPQSAAPSIENPSIHAPGNNVSTTSNPQPIPFPSKAELEARGYRFGPFHPEHNPLDIEMIAYYAKRGYRPLQPHEVDYAEFRCNGVPFAKASDVPHRPKPPEPSQPQKSREQAERDAIMAKIRRDREAPPKCAALENFRLAPTKRG